MPTDLNNGYKKPNNGESGAIFCPVLEDNWERVADHTHDGTDSTKIIASNITKQTATAASGASWTADGELYFQIITLPTGYAYDTTKIECRVGSGSDDGNVIYPTISKISDSQFKLWVNDNSIAVDLSYS